MFQTRLTGYGFLISLILLLVGSPVVAFARASSNLAGVVRGDSGVTLAEVRIDLLLEDQIILSTFSNQRGEYRLMNLDPGRYLLEISHPSAQSERRKIHLRLGRNLIQNLSLSSSNGLPLSEMLKSPKLQPMNRFQSLQRQQIPVSGAYVAPHPSHQNRHSEAKP
ncbi:MAG: carboxypeptidase-like regulatory domain-containing protein [Candidatus Cloacimonadaceae bacterium]|nr:carboxypeptidase-like regulatory domain-containing protein [Candidatus Cloacimonadaceae bacterium]